MDPVVRGKIESILKGLRYEETTESIERTLHELQEELGPEWLVSHTKSDNPECVVKFLFATKKAPGSEYTVWTCELKPDTAINEESK